MPCCDVFLLTLKFSGKSFFALPSFSIFFSEMCWSCVWISTLLVVSIQTYRWEDLWSELFCAEHYKCTSALLQPQLTNLPRNEVKQGEKESKLVEKAARENSYIIHPSKGDNILNIWTVCFRARKKPTVFHPIFLDCNIPYFLPYICKTAKHLEIKLASRAYKKEKQLCYYMLKGTVFSLKWI